jgi:hypothetical protein
MLTFSRLLADRFTVTLASGAFSFSILFFWCRGVDGQLVAHLEGLSHGTHYSHGLALKQQNVYSSDLWFSTFLAEKQWVFREPVTCLTLSVSNKTVSKFRGCLRFI